MPPRGRRLHGGDDQGVVGQDHLRGAQHPGAGAAEVRPRSTCGPRRRERRAPATSPPPEREGLGDGLQGGVGVGVGGGQGAEGGGGILPLVEHFERLHRQPPFGEGARLVEADHVHPRQSLDRRQFLHQHPAPPEADHADGEGHRGEQDQAFGDHGRDAGGGAPQRLLDPDVVPEAHLAPHQEGDRGDHPPGDDRQDPVDAVAQFAADQSEPLGLFGEAGGIGLGADPGRPVAPAPGRHEGAREHLVAGLLEDGVRLAGEQGLVHLEPLEAVTSPSTTIWSPGRSTSRSSRTTRSMGRSDLLAVAHHPGPRGAEQRQAVEGALGPDLLEDADRRVGEQHQAEEGVLDGGHDQHQDQQGAQQEVEEGEDVGPDDLAHGPAGGGGHRVHLAGGLALGHLGAAQPQSGGGRAGGAQGHRPSDGTGGGGRRPRGSGRPGRRARRPAGW